MALLQLQASNRPGQLKPAARATIREYTDSIPKNYERWEIKRMRKLCSIGISIYEYAALQDGCPLDGLNRPWLNLVMVHNTKAISLYSDIDSCSFTTPARQLTCKAP